MQKPNTLEVIEQFICDGLNCADIDKRAQAAELAREYMSMSTYQLEFRQSERKCRGDAKVPANG